MKRTSAILPFLFLAAAKLCAQTSTTTVLPAADATASTRSAPLAKTSSATVRCLFFRMGRNGSPADGGTSPVTIRVLPNPEGNTPVAVAQDFVHGVGEMWMAASWIAALCASHVTDTFIQDHEFLVKAGGMIDGPSAGMLITATMAALLRGDPILPDTAMTGTVNPDGTAGPVGGIVQKMEGAKKDGIKRMGFPLGCRFCEDMNTGKSEDLMEKAEKLGIEAVEIGDIYDAYQFLTGKALPRPAPVSEAKMQMSNALLRNLRDTTSALRDAAVERVKKLERSFQSLDEHVRKRQAQELVLLSNMLFRSNIAEKNGTATLAYNLALKANAQSRVAELYYEMGNHLSSGRLAAYKGVLDDQKNAALRGLDSLRDKIRPDISSNSLGGAVDAIYRYMLYSQARAQAEAGKYTERQFVAYTGKLEKELENGLSKTAVKSSAAKQRVLGDFLTGSSKESQHYRALAKESLARFAFAQTRAESAGHWPSFPNSKEKTVHVSPQLYQKLGKAYSAAASAGLASYDSIVITDELLNEMNMSKDNFVLKKTVLEEDYATVYCAEQAAKRAGLDNKDSFASLDAFASGVSAYHGATRMVNKAYNYQVVSGSEEAGAMELKYRKPLGHALDLARRRVLEECGRVETAAGFIPDSVKFSYDLANVLRDGSDNDKLNALRSYWTCIFLCDLTRMLSSEK